MNHEKIKKEIQLSGNIRDPLWVTRQFEKGRLFIGDELVTPAIFEELKICLRVISDIYEEAWDIDFRVVVTTTLKGRKRVPQIQIHINNIFILFPEVVIRNRSARSHTIKDLIVGIPLYVTSSHLKIGYLQGGRLHLTFAEWQSNYFHSHLSISSGSHITSRPIPYLDSFCTGSGEINIYHSELNADGINEERFLKYAMQIMSLVSYESIEGTPYRHMSNISARPQRGNVFTVNNSLSSIFISRIIDYYKNGKIRPPLTFMINSNGGYEVANDDNLQKFIYDVDLDDLDKQRYFCTQDTTNPLRYFQYGHNVGYSSSPPTNPNKMIFRGEEKRMVIEPPPGSTSAEVTYKVHPQLINNLKTHLEYELNKNEIRQSTINRYQNQSGDAREGIQSDPIPVSADS